MPKFTKARDEVNKFSLSQKILTGLIIFFLFFGVITRFTQGNIFSDFAYDTISMIRYSLIDGPVSSIANFSSDLSDLYKVRDENDDLRSQISSQKMYKADLDEEKRKVKELEELLKVREASGFESINACIINRDVQGWSNSITVSKGSNDGVSIDNAVITSKGLIGKISSVTNHTSTIKLLTSEKGDLQVSIKIELDKDKTTSGILEKYNSSEGKYVIRIFDSNASIKKGMKVITSGEGGVFPGGLIIGEVNSVEDLYTSKGKSAYVTPSVDFSDFDYVSILKGAQ